MPEERLSISSSARVHPDEGARHTFVNEHPFEPNSVKALETMIAFIKEHGSDRRASR